MNSHFNIFFGTRYRYLINISASSDLLNIASERCVSRVLDTSGHVRESCAAGIDLKRYMRVHHAREKAII